LIVTDNVVRDRLKQLHKGDHIQIVYSTETKNSTDAKSSTGTNNPPKNPTDATSQYVLKAWCVDSVSPGPWSRTWVLLASAGICFLLVLIFSGFKPKQLIISEDNRYSNSRFQLVIPPRLATVPVHAGASFFGERP
jgi:hypothetical protein